MKPPSNPAMPQTKRDEAPASQNSERGWYLYGITSRQTASKLTPSLATDAGEPVQAFEQGELAALVRPVALADFRPETLQARAEDLAWLEAMVRDHHQVVERIHEAGAVLPVTFGAVYPDRETLLAALAEQHDALLAQLEQLEGCDEWGVRLFADRQALQRLAGEYPALQQIKDEVAAASPGRAYLLKRKLADELTGATEEARVDLARTSYERLARCAVAGQSSPPPQQTAEEMGERAVLSATFLVQRAGSDQFLEEVQQLGEEQAGLRCEYSGPWPPYSFARLAEGEKQ